MRVRLSGDARTYLRKEAAYLRSHSHNAAKAFLDRMQDARKNLAKFPDMGLGIERLPVPGSRRLIVGDYLLDYDVVDNEIIIVSVRHGQQQPLLPEIDDDFDYEANTGKAPR